MQDFKQLYQAIVLKYATRLIMVGGVALLCASCSINARIKKADQKYEIGEYHAAGEMYRSLYSRVPAKERQLRARVAFRQGECYRKLNHQRTVAAYQNAIRNQYRDSIVYLRHAQALHQTGKYSDAVKSYDLYLKAYPNHTVALGGKYACLQMDQWRKSPTRYQVKIANDLNHKRSNNFAPSFIGLSADAIAFTSNRTQGRKIKKNNPITGTPLHKLYTTRKNAAGKWETVELIENIDTEFDQGVSTFTADGKTIYYSLAESTKNSDKGAQIFTSTRAGGTWSNPTSITLFNDSTITVAHPSISADGEHLYFVSDAPGGMGGNDIWRARLINGVWSEIENLGSQINTSEDELFPTIRANGELYFASNGHPGYGGLDLFKAVPAEDKGWLLFNMGSPFNTNSDDFGITFAGNSESGFFSSNRNERRGFDMIYSFELPELLYQVMGFVTDHQNQALDNAQVRIVGNDGTNAKVKVRKDGSFRFKINPNTEYALLATSRGYLNQKQQLSTQGVTNSKEFKLSFSLMPISQPVTIDNIFYEFGKWDLTPESEAGLQILVGLLTDNPNITMELSAHTDHVGNASANQQLSEKRAQSVVNYLIAKGIDAERLTPVGYGKERPVIVSEELAKKHNFLPLEQELTESFIGTLLPDQQEIAKQINRRTEFRVLRTTYKLY